MTNDQLWVLADRWKKAIQAVDSHTVKCRRRKGGCNHRIRKGLREGLAECNTVNASLIAAEEAARYTYLAEGGQLPVPDDFRKRLPKALRCH